MEIWNLVFMQDQIDASLEVVGRLPEENVDTGSSLERVATVLQGVDDVFQTDLFRPDPRGRGGAAPARRHGEDPRDDVSLKIIAEHGRATAFLIADGVLPANEGRGYILRRMLRRAVAHARRLGIARIRSSSPSIGTVIEGFGDAYPELRGERGVHPPGRELGGGAVLGDAAPGHRAVRRGEGARGRRRASRATTRSGSPTRRGSRSSSIEELAADAGLSRRLGPVRRAAGRAAGARAGRGEEGGDRAGCRSGPAHRVRRATTQPEAEAPVVAAARRRPRALEVAEEGQEVARVPRPDAVLRGGRRAGRRPGRDPHRHRHDPCHRHPARPATAIVHTGVVESGEIRGRPGRRTHEIDAARREATARAHTSTHVVHATLKDLLGEHARQAGSLVAPGRLRFDFPHPTSVPHEHARGGRARGEPAARGRRRRRGRRDVDGRGAARSGAVALFDEKYGDLRAGGRDRRLLARAVRRHPRRRAPGTSR